MGASVENTYMAQVMEQQERAQDVLAGKQRARRKIAPSAAPNLDLADSREFALAGAPGGALGRVSNGGEVPAVDYRITGWWMWKRVIVPPNAFVVHRRLGVEEPLNCGLGISFNFNPYSDSFLVVPAAMQTIMISANCICKERQGILVQGYVQWIIEDFATAYRKLDFSDPIEPMAVVNLQLREQAEAAIKDTVASMSIDDVLADKQPIVKVLTSRLRQLAEGEGDGRDGLGLRIITVQIKEAVVSSTRLWESLQRPFRAERSKEARLAELTHEREVRAKEADARQQQAQLEIESDQEVARLRSEAEAAEFDREQSEKVRRAEVEAETLLQLAERRKAKLTVDAELARLELESELARESLRGEANHAHELKQLELFARRREVENQVSQTLLQERLINRLPQIADKLPKPETLTSVNVGGVDGLAPLVDGVRRLVRGVTAGGNGNGHNG